MVEVYFFFGQCILMANWIRLDIIGGGIRAEEHPSETIDAVNGAGYFAIMGSPLHYIIHLFVSLSFYSFIIIDQSFHRQ